MKTADLIPLILLELNDSDQYGLELTKNIEDKSNGLIVIKQPTLYTVLKKLEKSKFITSYWLDSDIGGKRHYYKITDNGKLQVATLPSYQQLIENVINENNEEDSVEESNVEKTTPLEAVIISATVFNSNNIDSETEQQTNQNNMKVLESNNANSQQDGYYSSKFVESAPKLSKQDQERIFETKTSNSLELPEVAPLQPESMNIEYVDYINYKRDKNYQNAKAYTNGRIFSSILTSLYLLTAIFGILTMLKITPTQVMSISLIISAVIALFYPSITISAKKQIKKKAMQKSYYASISYRIYISIIIFFIGFIALEVYNLYIMKRQFLEMLSFENFADFYAELILFGAIIFDSLIKTILLRPRR